MLLVQISGLINKKSVKVVVKMAITAHVTQEEYHTMKMIKGNFLHP
jgi:hypothetical protein